MGTSSQHIFLILQVTSWPERKAKSSSFKSGRRRNCEKAMCQHIWCCWWFISIWTLLNTRDEDKQRNFPGLQKASFQQSSNPFSMFLNLDWFFHPTSVPTSPFSTSVCIIHTKCPSHRLWRLLNAIRPSSFSFGQNMCLTAFYSYFTWKAMI